jgi:hypothetical protein
MPKPVQYHTVMRSAIDSTHMTVRQVCEIAEVSWDKLNRACTGELYLQGEEFERVQSVIGAGRIRWAQLIASVAKVPFDYAAAKQESFDQARADIDAMIAEAKAATAALKKANGAIRGKNFRKWVVAEELRQGIKVRNLEAAAEIWDSVLRVEAGV